MTYYLALYHDGTYKLIQNLAPPVAGVAGLIEIPAKLYNDISDTNPPFVEVLKFSAALYNRSVTPENV